MSKLMETVCDIGLSVVIREFDRVISPIYGNQMEALCKIVEGKDRRCEILCDNGEPVGIIVYKKQPNDEYQQFGVDNSFEIKSLFVINEKANSGKGYGSKLYKRIEQEAFNSHADGIHVTVSETVPQSIQFFKKRGFIQMHQWQGKYQVGVTELLLFKKLAQI